MVANLLYLDFIPKPHYTYSVWLKIEIVTELILFFVSNSLTLIIECQIFYDSHYIDMYIESLIPEGVK